MSLPFKIDKTLNLKTAEEVIKSVGLDYEVGLAPAYAYIDKDGQKIGKRIPDRFATYRKDTMVTFNVVGSKYTICQNSKAFEFFDSIVGQGEAIYQSAGMLRNGVVMWLSAKLPSTISIPGTDVNNYLLFTNNHDGLRSLTVMFTPINVVCENTLAMALQDKRGNRMDIRHTSSLKEKVEESHRILGIVKKQTKEYQEVYDKMIDFKMTNFEIDNFIHSVFLSPTELNSIRAGMPFEVIVSTRKRNVLADVKEYSRTGIGQNIVSTKGTLFGAFSAITGYFTNSKPYSSEEHKLESMFFEGNDSRVMQKAFNLAVEKL